MFHTLTLHGGAATLVWGYRTVAVLRTWRIGKPQHGKWTLVATVAQANGWEVQRAARCRELLFTAPRDRTPWCFAVESIEDLGTSVRATLGPPLQ